MNKLKNWSGITAVIGVDWGDSGKGRIIDDLAQEADIIARYNGGSNAGHTVVNHYGKFALHIIPSGIFNQKATNLIGKGVAVDLESLIDDEIIQLKKSGVSWKNLVIDKQATLTMPWHKLRDGIREESRKYNKVGTTKRGVGPTYADRTERVGLRVGDLYSKNFREILEAEIKIQNRFFSLNLSSEKIYKKFKSYAKIIKPYIGQTIPILKEAIAKGKNVLFEGAQGWLLDIDNGTYPFVTSSNPGIVGIWRSYDLHPSLINNVIGITKAYTTRVGFGPMPSKIETNQRDIIIEKGHEIGTTSGRVRDPGWLDLVLLKAATDSNQVTQIAITKIDVLSKIPKIKICTGYKISGKPAHYIPGNSYYLSLCKPVYEQFPGWDEDLSQVRKFEDLPKNAKDYIKRIEEYTKTPVTFIGVGPGREEAIYV
ncbi:MAG: Adenylosuccinate synthetase [Candidatus Curtissbacteria bacterium GW2011_GWA1_40_47]|uniref:Adenylosuccinate synthetase n=1 Tax=Candidatus Curtissbacteria bacterium RIFOXYA1_FULL_41_14 TaxID=1797737 RepID=A0A1F5HC36_9BACT|nr:MAG: Adenylosuccinate synthetase [Candidatus Curtissbacteria bacterium GW2011_GWB1_40_28]KKR60833.1 MAG: Adenylosuccinate synthetase [Candidatus Curtissbacteria bacterium GW2011_GWA2_40_31]KKR62104.1 MAG: Adenylosuccinate synthetase [Microgenomates group bacterium GW2011_GWC1_40_35]KKR65692.1 MAG: Adenylosuccinate synthetase [Candidatus Curtissbacteria bacterium GW2011_GWA1_40_47]KKR77516.1 MAG: Adenylosuccinate synthetase [Candidatus Curtissbacteria bacterium GW2011_GWD1_40_8]KKS02378.1 MA